MKKYILKKVDDEPYLVREGKVYENLKFDNPDDVAEFCTEVLDLDSMSEEYTYLFCLNTKNRITEFFELSHGSQDRSIVDIKAIYTRMLLCSANRIIFVHNHPSGEVNPSDMDWIVYNKLVEAGNLLSFDVCDSLIIGYRSYYSMKYQEERFY